MRPLELKPGQVVDIGQGETLVHPDYAQAYTQLAPLVTEARAFLLERNVEAATEALNKARQVIAQSAMTWLYMPLDGDEQ